MQILVTRGSPTALRDLGLGALAESSDLVVRLPTPQPEVRDSGGLSHEVAYLDADPADDALVECMQMVKLEWERAHPDQSHLGHAAAGLWFFYWFAPGMRHVADLLRANDSDALRAAARDYVDKGFGWDGGPDVAGAP